MSNQQTLFGVYLVWWCSQSPWMYFATCRKPACSSKLTRLPFTRFNTCVWPIDLRWMIDASRNFTLQRRCIGFVLSDTDLAGSSASRPGSIDGFMLHQTLESSWGPNSSWPLCDSSDPACLGLWWRWRLGTTEGFHISVMQLITTHTHTTHSSKSFYYFILLWMQT